MRDNCPENGLQEQMEKLDKTVGKEGPNRDRDPKSPNSDFIQKSRFHFDSKRVNNQCVHKPNFRQGNYAHVHTGGLDRVSNNLDCVSHGSGMLGLSRAWIFF
jgi:hypothetical protein